MSLVQVAAAAGMRGSRGRWGPCPACGAEHSSDDGRPPVLLGKRINKHGEEVWRCVRGACGEGGDAIALAGHYLGLGGCPTKRDYWRAKRFVNEAEGVPEPEELADKPRVEHDVRGALARAVPLSVARATGLDQFLAKKKLTRAAPAGVLLHPPAWFPTGHPLVVGAFSGLGELKSMHGRSIDDRPPGRAKAWPRGMDAGGLLFLDPRFTRPWVRGQAPAPRRVVFAEGLTDYLACATIAPTIGVVSGSFDALRLIAWEPDMKLYSSVHADSQGDKYREKLADAVWPHVVRPIDLGRFDCLI